MLPRTQRFLVGIVSGYSESERVRAARELGAGTYVKKPYIKEKLGLAVRNELANRIERRLKPRPKIP
jgi:hypothetical protein